jgi:hypothetical protein
VELVPQHLGALFLPPVGTAPLRQGGGVSRRIVYAPSLAEPAELSGPFHK